MANILKKKKAISLRVKGNSITEIAEKIKVPKSTVSIWCRNIRLGKKQIERLAKRQISGSYKGRMKFLEKIRNERLFQTEELRKKGINDIGKINKRDLFIAGIALYLSEGSTADCNEDVSFTNSDFKAILFIKRWFTEICTIPLDRFTVQIRVNKLHKNRTKDIEKYWSATMGIPFRQFTKTILIKANSKKVYPDNNNYYGTIRLKVRRGTELRRKINGWIEGLLKI